MSANTDQLMNEDEAQQFIKSKEEMSVTLGQLLNGVGTSPHPTLPPNGPLSRLYGKRFPEGKGQLGYKFRRLMRDVLQEVDTFGPTQKEIVEKYGTLNKETQQYFVEGENVEKFKAEINEASSVEITLRHSQMPELREFWEVSPAEDEALSWLVGE